LVLGSSSLAFIGDGLLRQVAYEGLRAEKPAAEVKPSGQSDGAQSKSHRARFDGA